MKSFAPCLALLALACLTPAAAQDAPARAEEAKPLAAKVELVVPAGAQAGPDFDVERATQAWVETLPVDKRERSDNYFEGGYWLRLFTLLYGLAVAWVFLFGRLSARIRDFATSHSKGPITQSMAYAPLYILAATVLDFPLSWYSGFFREHQYELSTQTFGAWLGDEAKGLLIALIVGTLLIMALYAVFRRTGRAWWLWGSGVAMVFLIIGAMIYPVWIAPMFNDYKPLPAGPLRDNILSIARATGVPAEEVYWFDASRQTTRISANVAGFGATTRIALNDNLLNRSAPESIESVMGHELGHYVLNHVYEGLIYSAVVFVLAFAAVAWGFTRAVERWGQRWGVSGITDPAGVPLLGVLFSIVFFLLTPVNNNITRTNEIEADRFGIATSGQPDGFAAVAMQLSEYRKISPGYWEEILFYTHPSGENRVRAAMQWKKEHMPAASPP
ncbi:MAG: M48 family metallopeptidase [Gammaproteobacteria bacterium]